MQNKITSWINFKWRKLIHYSLIVCIILFQVIIGAYFYNEYVNEKKVGFIDEQLKELQQLENLTNSSRSHLQEAQKQFHKYVQTQTEGDLNAYFSSVESLRKGLDSIATFQKRTPSLNKLWINTPENSSKIKELQILMDSSKHVISNNAVPALEMSQLKPFTYDYDFNQYDIETQTYSDSVAKKGLFGRLKDAISGKVNVKKDSVVITVKGAKGSLEDKVKADMDSIFRLMNNYYANNVRVIQKNASKRVTQSLDNSGRFYGTFNNLMVYSNELMELYDGSVKKSKQQLEKELEAQNEKGKKVRSSLILGLIVLAFIVSLILMFFTRVAFGYEARLKKAKKVIEENLNFKNRVLGMVSHEMRSPLKMIDLFLKRIDKKNTDETIKDYLKSINFTNHNLLMQSNQILEYAKNQNVQNALVMHTFNVKNEIDSVLTAIRPYIESRNNQFLVESNLSDDIIVNSDNIKMNQLFINILANANKFTEYGTITVKTEVSESTNKNIKLTTHIIDTGAGISKDDLKKIFEPYYQGVLSKDVENIGAGLGLNLCKEIVGLFHGAITADSELGKGTTVSFEIYLNK